jgi:hypothetical protein
MTWEQILILSWTPEKWSQPLNKKVDVIHKALCLSTFETLSLFDPKSDGR